MALIISLAMPIFVSADTGAGIKPSSIFYFFDIAAEKISLFFTFDEKAKVEKVLSYVDERASELKEVALEDKPQALEAAVQNYNKYLESVITHSKKAEDDEIEDLLGTLYENTEKHKTELGEIIPELTEDARDVILNVIETNQEFQKDLLKEIVELRQTVEELSAETEKLKEEIEELKEKKSVTLPEVDDEVLAEDGDEGIIIEEPIEIPDVPKKKEPLIIEFPSGMIVEVDENGNIIRTIQEAPQKDYTPPPAVPPAGNVPTNLSISLESTDITTGSAHIEWSTNIPTESKIFLTHPNGSIKIISSLSGLSTKHIADIPSLISNSSYTYIIEAIADTQSKKLDGSFKTKEQTVGAESINNPNDSNPSFRIFSNREFTIKKLVFWDDDNSCNSQNKTLSHLNLQIPYQGMDAFEDSNSRFIYNFDGDGLRLSDVTMRFAGTFGDEPSSGCLGYAWHLSFLGDESIIYAENGTRISFPTVNLYKAFPPPFEIIQTHLSGNTARYTFYNRSPKYIGYTSAKIKVWQDEINDPHEDVRVEVYLDGQLVSPIRQNTGTNTRGDFTVPASSITGTSEETATVVIVPLSNESTLYCNSCGHLVIPTAPRANYPADVAAYIRLETHAETNGVNTPNDSYFVKLISFEGETFGTQGTQTNTGRTIYTF